MKGKIFYEGKEFHFSNLWRLTIQTGGKLWVFDTNTDVALWFKIAPMGGHAGVGNYLKQWRKRHTYNQAKAASILGISQSMVSKIEKNTRSMPIEVFKKIHEEIRAYYKKE